MNSITEKRLTIDDVAKMYSCEYQKVRYMFLSRDRRNPFPSFKIGNRWYVRENELVQWEDRQKQICGA